MKTVCMLVQSVYDSDPRVRRKAEALVAEGYSVDVLALRPPDGRATYTLNGVRVITVALGKKRASLARYAFEYAAFFAWAFVRLLLLTRRRRYAVIDVNTLPDFLVFAAAPARWMGARIILDMHEIMPEFYVSKYGIAPTSPLVRLLEFLERVSFEFADHVLTINEPIQDLLASRGLHRGKSTVVMNAADEVRFAGNPSPPAADAGQARPPFVMMYHGTLTRLYGLDIAVDAFARALPDMPGAELWILGSGPELEALRDQAQRCGVASSVRLVGQVPAGAIPGWLSRCDAGILPIRRDAFLDFAFPNKLPEFIVAGKAVLVSRLKAIRHYFSEAALAFFEPNDPADVARQMIRLYGNRELRDRLAARAAEDYAPIRWELMKRRYLDVVADAAGSKDRAAARQPAETTAVAG